jgi:hypothetical protein
MPVSKAEFDAGTAPNCRNKNCKSYGKPHPNCHCFEHVNGMLIGHAPRYAKGGRVPEPSFCASGGDPMHKKDCPYYCEGGMSYAKGGEAEMDDSKDHEMMLDHVALECMNAIESKDKADFKAAFQVLLADCILKMNPEMDEGDKENVNG